MQATTHVRRWGGRIAFLGAGALLIASATPAAASSSHDEHHNGAPDFGTNVTIFDPSMPLADIQAQVDALANQQRDNEMGTARHAVYFMPGTYGTADPPLRVEVGYYTEVAGLGASPDDATINGTIEVYNRCLADGGTSNCLALVNFWRTLSNLKLNISANDRGCQSGTDFWAVSQAVSMRRLDISGGNLSLMDYCSAGPQYASGGFIADSKLPFTINGSQQQWLVRNSVVAGWSNGVWNQVFSGVVGAPSEANFPTDPYTTLPTTSVSREKPYLFVDAKGGYNVRVPSARTDSSGVSWDAGITAGRTISIKDFYIAKPGDSVREINNQLARGKNLILTPGVYDIGSTINIKRANTVVLGMGHATLTSSHGATPMEVADVPGVVIAGVSFDAGPQKSKALLVVGKEKAKHGPDGHDAHGSDGQGDHHDVALNPTTLSDVYFRVGGPHAGSVDTALVVNSDNVLIDHTWVWRADHGVEGFTQGVNGDTDRWNTNIGRVGVVVNGDNVTATGLFVEHFQTYNTMWNGDGGTVVFYQNELAYDPPTQADWTQPNGELGYPAYKVAADVTTHHLYGAGVYVFNQNNPAIVTENGFEVPNAAGVQLHHIMTVNLSAGTINHVVDGVGGAAIPANTGVPVYINDYPTP